MKRFVLLRNFDTGREARDFVIMVQALLERTPSYLGGWEWQATTKMINGERVRGPMLLRNGDRDVFAYRDYLPNGAGDVYCHPDMRDWIQGGMQGLPPSAPPPLREELIQIDHRTT